VWPLAQDYTGPDGQRRTRTGFLARVRVEDYGPGRIRPHERTHPGPKEDRLKLTRATRANLSPIFSLYDDSDGTAAQVLAEATSAEPWGTTTDDDGTVNRLWRVADEGTVAALARALEPVELLIADGHHRYETAVAFREEDPSATHLMAVLVSSRAPGLEIFPTHRLVQGVGDVPGTPVDGPGDGVVLYRDGRYLRVDTDDDFGPRVVESLAPEGVGYTAYADEAVAVVDRGDAAAAFLLEPVTVEQVARFAHAGETMPQKSTFFYPKLTSGLLFHPL
jgi:uncharacterized protein (DUF1015 family)